MLILAGISISAIVHSGLFDKAKEAEDKYSQAQNEEDEYLREYQNLLHGYTSGSGTGLGGGSSSGSGSGSGTNTSGESGTGTGTGNNTSSGDNTSSGSDTSEEDVILSTDVDFGEITWSNGKASVEIRTNTKYYIEYQKNATIDGNWTKVQTAGVSVTVENLNNNDILYARLTNGTKTGKYKIKPIVDTTNPRVTVSLSEITTESITAMVNAVDNETGIGEDAIYTFYIKETDAEEETYEEKQSNTLTTCIITGLKQSTEYTVKVEVKDIAGNTGTGTDATRTEVMPDADDNIETGNITFGEAEWDNGQASIEISTSTNYYIEYQINGITEGNWTRVETAGESVTVSELVDGYILYARLTDGTNAGDYATLEIVEPAPTFTTVANAPDISQFNESTTYYVTWAPDEDDEGLYNIDDETLISGTVPNGWYDYTEGVNKWANIKTTGGGNTCYWVWIPRYAYKITYTTASSRESGTIEVKFLKEDTNVPVGETDAITNTTPGDGKWLVHPAFTNSGNGGFGELTGIWVAKFEASSSLVSEETLSSDLASRNYGGGNTTSYKVRVKPNVTSWRNITVNNIFTVCQNLTAEGNSLVGSTNLDSHMMKNTEWGACAYLSRSQYGKNGEVWNNPYYNNTTNCSPITGLCSKATNGEKVSTADLDETCKYNELGGGNASTTGNVYGIYDMAGGAWEYTAGYLSGVTGNSNYTTLANSHNKYKDKYAGTAVNETNYYANAGKYGDALYETSSSGYHYEKSWNSGSSYYAIYSHPMFMRGSYSGNSKSVSVFAFYYATGEANNSVSFRPVVVSSQP